MITFSKDAEKALAGNGPVVALESTIITHGMPYPDNLRTAREVEQAVRDAGAVPATIAVLDGTFHAGLSDADLEKLAKAENVLKLSRADLGFAASAGRTGSTTVAATMQIAQLAGIEVFATGGIGGVHRGVADHFDISADLAEFSRSRVIVVSAGAKAILDLPKTLEVLETNGVPVAGYRTDMFPAFWSARSDLPLNIRLDSPQDIAAFHKARARLKDPGGMLVANPIPAAAEIPQSEIGPAIEFALRTAAEKGIAGKAVTPFLLQTIFEKTAGKSLEANKALVLNNARLAAEIAIALKD